MTKPRPPIRKARSTRSHSSGHPLTVQSEDYVERIHELIERKGYARVSDIAEELHLTPSTVSNMVRRLATLGLIEVEKYRGLILTEKGRAVAQSIHSRHVIISQFLETLGVDSADVQQDVEGIEHHISASTLQAIEALTAALRRHPAVLKEVLSRNGGTVV
jgi:Mn-dependent DtxR family transcriptional regulator